MPVSRHGRNGLALAIGLLGYGGLLPPMAGGQGLAAAEARAFYTRKRVNGVWVTGRFPKALAAAGAATAAGTAAAASPPPRTSGEPALDRSVKVSAAATPDNIATGQPKAEHLAKLQKALEVRAQEIAVSARETTGSTAPASEPRPQVRSVSFDFETGIKTTTYSGNVAVKEAFDLAASRALAAPPPVAAVLAPASSPGR